LSFKTTVVLGAGPLGLMAAIEARQNFVRDVTLVEKRGGYTRNNVPVLDQKMIRHLQEINVARSIWTSGEPGDSIAFSRIEEGLLSKALSVGVKVERGWMAEGLIGRNKNKYGRYKSVALTLRQWDAQRKKAVGGGAFRVLDADFLVVSTGGNAAADPLITNKLGFSFHKLAPTNYGAFGIFDAEEKDYTYNPERERRKQEANQLAKTVAGGKIGFHTIDHSYLLITLRNCSPADFKRLQGAPAELKKVLLTIGESYGAVVMKNLKDVDKNIALFEISIQRATQFYSQEYPAVLLGDSAVTPHPEKASGIGTGYFGFEKLKELFQELKKLDRSDNTETHFSSFNSAMEIIASKKALEGTRSILSNNIETLANYINRLKADQAKLTTPQAKQFFAEVVQLNRLELLRADLETHNNLTEILVKALEGHGLPQSGVAIGELWEIIRQTHKEIQTMIGQTDFMSENLAKIASRYA
jgi:hypothetical protein